MFLNNLHHSEGLCNENWDEFITLDRKVTEEHVPILEELKQNGYDGVEIPLFDFDTKNNKILHKHLDRPELGCTTVTVMPEEANPISNDKAVRSGVEALENAIRQTVLLGGDVLCGPLTAPCGLLTAIHVPGRVEIWGGSIA